MRIVIRPVAEPQREIDLTHRLVSAVAEELWRLYGGNDHLNWVEAERHLERIIGDARREAAEAASIPAHSPDGEASLERRRGIPREAVACAKCPRRASHGTHEGGLYAVRAVGIVSASAGAERSPTKGHTTSGRRRGDDSECADVHSESGV